MEKTIIALFVLINLSCYKEVKIDIPDKEILPVVNSILQTDSIISLSLNKTQPILENGPTEITEAIVTLYEDGQEKEFLEFDGDTFKSKEVAEINKEYKIVVEIPGFETVTAEERLVGFPNIISASFKDSVKIGDEGDLFSQATIVIENTPEQDYFELYMYVSGINDDVQDDGFYGENPRSDLFFDEVLNDVVIQNEGLLSFIPQELVFSDELMTEDEYKLRINYRPFNSNIYTDLPSVDFFLVIELRKVSKNYYEYKKTFTQHVETQFGDIWDGVGQPLPVFNNIQNGYGIFAGYSQVTDTIRKE